MKYLLMMCLFLVACGAATAATVPQLKANEAPVGSKDADPVDVREELAYQASMEHIQDRMLREKMLLEEDLHNGDGKAFLKDQEDFCEIDTFVDTRGVHHHKPYCE